MDITAHYGAFENTFQLTPPHCIRHLDWPTYHRGVRILGPININSIVLSIMFINIYVSYMYLSAFGSW